MSYAILVRMARTDVKTEHKFLNAMRAQLVLDQADETSKHLNLANQLRDLNNKIEKAKADLYESEEWLEEVEGKNRVTKLKEMERDATRDFRKQMDFLLELIWNKKQDIFRINSEIMTIGSEIRRLEAFF